MRRGLLLVLASVVLQAQITQPENAQAWKTLASERIRNKDYSGAISALEHVLDLREGDDATALSLAVASFELAQTSSDEARPSAIEQARLWNRRQLHNDPSNKETLYRIGLIAWMEVRPALEKARSTNGVRHEDPGPLHSRADRHELLDKYEASLEEGISNLELAIEFDSQFDAAMEQLSLLIRARADLRDSAADYTKDIELADEWVSRELEVKKRKGETTPSLPALPSERIRVESSVQNARLIRKIDPICPPLAIQAKISGVVKFAVVVGKDGTVQSIQTMGGHPLLVPDALAAVKQWQYLPTLLNAAPVEVLTQIDVEMPCGK